MRDEESKSLYIERGGKKYHELINQVKIVVLWYVEHDSCNILCYRSVWKNFALSTVMVRQLLIAFNKCYFIIKGYCEFKM